jgi:hypothetical protein
MPADINGNLLINSPPSVPRSVQKYSRYDSRIIWDHPAEVHAIQQSDGSYQLTPEYLKWRQKLQFNKDPVRYPVGFDKKFRGSCLFALKDHVENGELVIENRRLNYVEARKEIYCELYTRLVRKEEKFKELQERLRKGENLLIIEVDLCHQEDLEYYKEKYGVGDDFIVNNTMLVTKENLNIMLNDTKHPFGHGYIVSSLLMDINLLE